MVAAWSYGAQLWAVGRGSVCGRGGEQALLSPGFPTELHAERSLHCDPAPTAEHHAGLLEAGLRLRLHLHRHAQPAAPVQLRLGEGPAGRGWLTAAHATARSGHIPNIRGWIPALPPIG